MDWNNSSPWIWGSLFPGAKHQLKVLWYRTLQPGRNIGFITRVALNLDFKLMVFARFWECHYLCWGIWPINLSFWRHRQWVKHLPNKLHIWRLSSRRDFIGIEYPAYIYGQSRSQFAFRQLVSLLRLDSLRRLSMEPLTHELSTHPVTFFTDPSWFITMISSATHNQFVRQYTVSSYIYLLLCLIYAGEFWTKYFLNASRYCILPSSVHNQWPLWASAREPPWDWE